MSATAVGMTPAIVDRESLVQRCEQVVLGTAAGFHDRDPGRRVRDEYVHQPVATGRGRELRDPRGHVEHALSITGADLERRCLHDAEA